jgi:hypothetical protein
MNNFTLTDWDKDLIEVQLSNNEYDSDQELADFFVSNGIDREFAEMIIEKERKNFFTDPLYEIDWDNY